MAFQARTNRNAKLLRLPEPSLDVAAGTTITVLEEEAGIGTVSVTVEGTAKLGSMEASHYDRI